MCAAGRAKTPSASIAPCSARTAEWIISCTRPASPLPICTSIVGRRGKRQRRRTRLPRTGVPPGGRRGGRGQRMGPRRLHLGSRRRRRHRVGVRRRPEGALLVGGGVHLTWRPPSGVEPTEMRSPGGPGASPRARHSGEHSGSERSRLSPAARSSSRMTACRPPCTSACWSSARAIRAMAAAVGGGMSSKDPRKSKRIRDETGCRPSAMSMSVSGLSVGKAVVGWGGHGAGATPGHPLRVVARPYCQFASGTKTARMATDQTSVYVAA